MQTSWPKERRARSCSRSTGPQRVRPTKRAIAINTTAIVAIAAGRDLASRLIRFEASATTPQKALVTCGPEIEPAGSRGLVERCSDIQANGSRQTVLVWGPVGPLL